MTRPKTPLPAFLRQKPNPTPFGLGALALGVLVHSLPGAWSLVGLDGTFRGYLILAGLALAPVLLSLLLAGVTLQSGWLWGPVSWCARAGIFLGSFGVALAVVGKLLLLSRALDALALGFPMVTLGWVPGVFLGLLLGLAFAIFSGPVLLPLLRAQRFPAHDDIEQLLWCAGWWLGLLGLSSAYLYKDTLFALLGLGCFALGVMGAFFAVARRSERAAWLARVRRGEEPDWCILPAAREAADLALPLFFADHRADGFLYRRKASPDGPYRCAWHYLPVARVPLR